MVTGRDASRAARALKRAVISALTAGAINVRDLELAPTPVVRYAAAGSDASGGVLLRTTPGDPQSVDITFLDAEGRDVSAGVQRRIERVFSRQEFRRAFPGEIAELSFPSRAVDDYARELLRRIDVTGVREARLKVVIDTAGGAAALVLPSLLGRLGVDVLTIHNGVQETAGSGSTAEHLREMAQLGVDRRVLGRCLRGAVRPRGRAPVPRRRAR